MDQKGGSDPVVILNKIVKKILSYYELLSLPASSRYPLNGHINVDVPEMYDKCFENNLTVTKNCVPKKSLVYFPMTTNVFIKSNFSNRIRNGTCDKGQVI
jgi:hypothetical protein